MTAAVQPGLPGVPWSEPRAASDQELEAIALTVDVHVGNTMFRKGTPLLALVQQHRAFYGQLYQGWDKEFS